MGCRKGGEVDMTTPQQDALLPCPFCGSHDIAEFSCDDIKALSEFKKLYPTWWYKIGVCNITRDFDCGPQANSPEIKYARPGNIWDNGFTCDHYGTIADAIYDVMEQIRAAAAL